MEERSRQGCKDVVVRIDPGKPVNKALEIIRFILRQNRDYDKISLALAEDR